IVEVNEPPLLVGVALPPREPRVARVLVTAPDRLGEAAMPAARVGVHVHAEALEVLVRELGVHHEREVHRSLLRACTTRSGPRPERYSAASSSWLNAAASRCRLHVDSTRSTVSPARAQS